MNSKHGRSAKVPSPDPGAEFLEIALTAITRNPDQPRKLFDATKLQELARSIAAGGLLQPITVRRLGAGFQLVAGERRWRAHQLLAEADHREPATILARVVTMTELQQDVAAIVENAQRVDVTPLEEADAFARLTDKGMTAEEIAAQCGVAPFRVRWRLMLLNLAPEIRSLFASGNLDRQQAMEIARLPVGRDQFAILQLINRGSLSSWKAVRTAVDSLLDRETQDQLFPDLAATDPEHLKTRNRMARKIDKISALVAAGWADGDCQIASMIDANSAEKMADQLAGIRAAVSRMERDLRNAAGQALAEAS